MRHDLDPFYQELYVKGRLNMDMRFLEKAAKEGKETQPPGWLIANLEQVRSEQKMLAGAIVRYPHLTHGAYTGFIMGWAYLLSAVSVPAIAILMLLQFAVLWVRSAVRVAAWGSYVAFLDARAAAALPWAMDMGISFGPDAHPAMKTPSICASTGLILG